MLLLEQLLELERTLETQLQENIIYKHLQSVKSMIREYRASPSMMNSFKSAPAYKDDVINIVTEYVNKNSNKPSTVKEFMPALEEAGVIIGGSNPAVSVATLLRFSNKFNLGENRTWTLKEWTVESKEDNDITSDKLRG